MQFYDDVFVPLCVAKGKSPSAALIDMGISKPTGTRWKQGHVPTTYTIKRIADYFGVDFDALKRGEIIYKKPTTDEGDGLSEKDERLLKWFRSLPPEKQKAILIAQDAPEDLL